MSDPESIENIPSSVPPNTQIQLMGVPDDQEYVNRLAAAVKDITLSCGRYMDLSLLDGITVGRGYDAALQAVDLGYASSTTKTYTDTEKLIGIDLLPLK
ncbi:MULTISPECIES: hypothetical protein [Kosakonia]|jgi:hypothetical protein|uniref:hypothetical protein n=1 Tax=Kosakonia cowanii TaxID=208223 RepID=UPI00289B2E1C|nr:hypothetical protein [Kosakonia cowanii]